LNRSSKQNRHAIAEANIGLRDVDKVTAERLAGQHSGAHSPLPEEGFMKFVATSFLLAMAFGSINATAGESLVPADAGNRTTAACESAFRSSSAASTCSLKGIRFSGGICTVTAECKRNYPWPPGVNTFTGSIDRVYGLVNCDGTMRYGSC